MLGFLHFFQSSYIEFVLFFAGKCENKHAQLENYDNLPGETKPNVFWGNQKIWDFDILTALNYKLKVPYPLGYRQVAPAQPEAHGQFSRGWQRVGSAFPSSPKSRPPRRSRLLMRLLLSPYSPLLVLLHRVAWPVIIWSLIAAWINLFFDGRGLGTPLWNVNLLPLPSRALLHMNMKLSKIFCGLFSVKFFCLQTPYRSLYSFQVYCRLLTLTSTYWVTFYMVWHSPALICFFRNYISLSFGLQFLDCGKYLFSLNCESCFSFLLLEA